MLADLLVDAAAHIILVKRGDSARELEAIEQLKGEVRAREQRFVDDVLTLHAFGAEDYRYTALPVEDGAWGTDLFNPEALAKFGIKTGSAAAVGAMAGLAVDAMVGGITLGAAAATGAAVGAVVGAVREKGRDVYSQLRGYSELRVDLSTLRLMTMRNATLIEALLRRGHASQDPLKLERDAEKSQEILERIDITGSVRKARVNPRWSRIRPDFASDTTIDTGRTSARDALASIIEPALRALSGAD